MTENEAIERIRSGICNERGTQRFCRDSCMYGIDKCAYSMAIQALEEIQQYRAIGTVEEIWQKLKNMSLVIDTDRDLLNRYIAIGTIEEFKALKEKSVAKKPAFEGDGCYNGEIVLDTWICPNCEKDYEVDYDDYDYCPNCGQHIDHSGLTEDD